MENTDQQPWVKNYQPGVPARIELPTESLVDMLERSWSEGISKAQVSHIVGHKRALGPERRYVRSVLPRAVFSSLAAWGRGADPDGLRRAGACVAVLAATAAGYFRGRRVAHGSGSLLSGSTPAPLKAPPWREAT